MLRSRSASRKDLPCSVACTALASVHDADKQRHCSRYVSLGSWLCENAPAEALTAGEVGALNHFREFEEFLV
jgi:hypothetical protein